MIHIGGCDSMSWDLDVFKKTRPGETGILPYMYYTPRNWG